VYRNRHVTGLRINFDIADVSGEGWSGSLGIHRHLGADRSTGAGRLNRDFGQGQRIKAPGIGPGRIGAAIPPINRFGADIPNHRRPLLQLVDDLFGRLHGAMPVANVTRLPPVT
jgi:hypothetical protein